MKIKKEFEKIEFMDRTYMEKFLKNKPFGEAIAAAKDGYMIARRGWNGKGLFVFAQVPAVIGMDIVPKMQSLPQSVKNEFEKRHNDNPLEYPAIQYNNQLALVDTDNNITGWSPSTSDAMAEDWIIYEKE